MKRNIAFFTAALAALLALSPSLSCALADPATPAPAPLRVDSDTLYPGMDKTYSEGYLPKIENGRVEIVLLLVGETADGRVTLTADLGSTADTPFVYGNYTQTVSGSGSYVFTFSIPLQKERVNGIYPIAFEARYLDSGGEATERIFTVFVTVTDGRTAGAEAAPARETAQLPELFIADCAITPSAITGGEGFSVTVSIENIGNIRAKRVKLLYSGEEGIIPADVNGALLLDDIRSGKSASATVEFTTAPDIIAGNRTFSVTLEYGDAYGESYSSTRSFLISVSQPLRITFDSISAPKEVTSGEVISFPANVFNIGKTTLRNVTVTAEGRGLYPISSVFLGDIRPGESGSGELEIFVGSLSSSGTGGAYGQTSGSYTVTCLDDGGNEYVETVPFSFTILEPDEAATAPVEEEPEPALQWWVAVLVAAAVICVIVAVTVVAKVLRAVRIR